MKKIKVMIIFLMSLFIFSSCETYSQVIYDEERIEVVTTTSNISYSTIITYGTPFYIDNILSYYLYNGIYYYPYYWNNILCFKPYRYIQPRGFRYIPTRHHRPDYRFMNPSVRHRYVPNRPRPNTRLLTSRSSTQQPRINPIPRNTQPRPNINQQRPMNQSRPNIQSRPQGNVHSNSHGHFGGSRR